MAMINCFKCKTLLFDSVVRCPNCGANLVADEKKPAPLSPRQVSGEQWKELEELLNRVASEREQDDDGPGSAPTANATSALQMIRKLGMETA